MIYLYYFSLLFSRILTMKYILLCRLEMQRPYKIIRSEERPMNILLVLKRYGDKEEFMSLLLIPHHLRQTFRDMKRLHVKIKGENVVMKLKFFGCKTFKGCMPIISISGKGIVKYLV